MRFILLCIASVFLPGCASVIGSKLQPLTVQTILDNKEVVSVGCTLTNDVGKWFVTAPGSVTVQKSTADLAVDCKREGVGYGTGTVVSKANGGAWGNILAGGVIGYVVDRNTGAGFDYPNQVTVTMSRFGPSPGEVAQQSAAPPQPEPGSLMNPKPVTVAKAPPPSTGEDAFVAGKFGREAQCGALDTPAVLAAKGPGYETYSMACASGDTLMIRCELGNCRALR